MRFIRHGCELWLVGVTAWVLTLSHQAVSFAEHPESAAIVAPTTVMMHGHARPFQVVNLKPSIKGVLKSILVAEGDDVQPGQILATLDDRLAQAAVRIAKAQNDQTARIHFAEHAVKLAENLVDRLTIVGEAQVASEFEIDKARAGRDQAKEMLAESIENQVLAKRKLELEQIRLESHYIRAPFRATVLKINGVSGETLDGEQPLIVLVQLEKLKVELHLPIDWFGKTTVGKIYRMRASEPVNQTLSGHLLYTAPVIDAGTQTFRCVFEILNPECQLPAGFVVRLESSTPLDSDPNELSDSLHSTIVKPVSSKTLGP